MALRMARYVSGEATYTFEDNIDLTAPHTYTTKVSEIKDNPSGWAAL